MQFPGCPCHIRLSEHSGDHSHAVNAGAVQLRNVVRCNAADGNHRNADCLSGCRTARHRAAGWRHAWCWCEKRRRSPDRLRRLVPPATASATLCALVPMIALIAQDLPCLLHLHVTLSHMDTVCTQHPCRLYIVINDAGNSRHRGTAAKWDTPARFSRFGGTVLFPDLQHGDAAGDGTAAPGSARSAAGAVTAYS